MFHLTEHISKDELIAFCKKYQISKLSLFGSALRDELKKGSDIDILVEFKKGCVPGLLTLSGMEIELSDAIGKKIDIRTPAELSRYFRDAVLAEARIEYAG